MRDPLTLALLALAVGYGARELVELVRRSHRTRLEVLQAAEKRVEHLEGVFAVLQRRVLEVEAGAAETKSKLDAHETDLSTLAVRVGTKRAN